ncbi:MAG TPA: ATPase domain-containing protein [Longimicrobiales bacterium]|nr:ATPase domain-containing protein [Longimicrobiales bacterium]
MARKKRAQSDWSIRSLATGVPGLDAVLGEGLPEYSFNLIAGGPGAGKTTLAQQIVFSAATPERPAIYFTVLGEPPLKMLRYQRQYTFFDPALIGSAVHFINLSEEVLEGGPARVLERIVEEVERLKPRIVVVDSFRSIARVEHGADGSAMAIDHFVQRLALHLTTWEVTSFLIGEYGSDEFPNPVFTVADGVFWLSQVTDRNSVVRKLQITKMRGCAPMPGLHTFRITDRGLQVFPRIPEQQQARAPKISGRHSTGVPGLDELMGGGIPIGDAVMIAGPTGTGKTTFAAQFVEAAGRNGESVVVAVFEEYPEEYLARLQAREVIADMDRDGRLKLIYLRPLDLSVDETLSEILDGVEEIGATRVVIDSLSGFEVALAPAFREDFRESLYRLVGALTASGVTVYMTSEVVGGHPALNFTNDRVSFITDDVISQRYIEVDGRLQKVLVVVKMRGSEHSSEFRTYELGPDGAIVGGPLTGYHGILTGIPELQAIPDGSGGRSDAEAR